MIPKNVNSFDLDTILEWWVLIVGVLILIGEAAVAYLFLDLVFRSMPLENLRRSMSRAGLVYGAAGVGVTALAACLGWRWSGIAGLVTSLPGFSIWWLLWRFGIRKQFGK